jgi:hypothetical protein
MSSQCLRAEPRSLSVRGASWQRAQRRCASRVRRLLPRQRTDVLGEESLGKPGGQLLRQPSRLEARLSLVLSMTGLVPCERRGVRSRKHSMCWNA